jgi:uridine phosphorylase
MNNPGGSMKKKTEKALICAEQLVTDKAAKGIFGTGKPGFKTAILAFLPVNEIKDKFCEKQGRQIPMSHYWNTWVREDNMVLAGPFFGGPVCAAAMEELTACGVTNYIGLGYSGALEPGVPPCSIMTATAGLNSDGTTKEYTKKRVISADPEMLERLREAIQKRGLPDISGKVWTTDAIYREFPSIVAYWKGKGAQFVNMETSTFYAVAQELGVKAAYLSVISDNLSGEKWSGWFPDHHAAMVQAYDIALEAAESI